MRFTSDRQRKAVMSTLRGRKLFSSARRLYHGTSDKHLGFIFSSGLKDAYFGKGLRYPLMQSLKESDKVGGNPVIISIPLKRFEVKHLKLDLSPPQGTALRYRKRIQVQERDIKRVVSKLSRVERNKRLSVKFLK